MSKIRKVISDDENDGDAHVVLPKSTTSALVTFGDSEDDEPSPHALNPPTSHNPVSSSVVSERVTASSSMAARFALKPSSSASNQVAPKEKKQSISKSNKQKKHHKSGKNQKRPASSSESSDSDSDSDSDDSDSDDSSSDSDAPKSKKPVKALMANPKRPEPQKKAIISKSNNTKKRKQSASDSDEVSSSDGDDSKSGDDDIGIDKSNIVHGRRARKPIKYNFDDSDEDEDE